MLSHKSHLHLLNAFPENFKRYFSISYYAYDIPHCDLTPPLGLWYELESTHLLEDASTHKFGFFGHLVFEKKIIVILYIFFIYNYVKFIFPLWSHLTLRDHDLNKVDSTLPEDAYSQVQDFLVFEKIVQDFLYTCIFLLCRVAIMKMNYM